MAHLEFLDDALHDLTGLDGRARKKVLARLVQLEAQPEMGAPLGSRAASNLTTFRKVVVGRNTYRILYKLGPDGELIVIWVIAGRADNECYNIAAQRLADYGDSPPLAELAEVLRALRRD